FRYFPLKNSSVVQTMQRFLKENYRKNLALKFIRINNVTYLIVIILFENLLLLRNRQPSKG
ncbi:MAG: hypothetical protein ACI85O_002948, partial [Saprospiraceae bacterium]